MNKLVLTSIMTLIAITPAMPARAAVIVVNAMTDDATNNDNCTLREAILSANSDVAIDGCTAGSGADLIQLPAGTYSISVANTAGDNEDAGLEGDIDISSQVEIAGESASTTIIDAHQVDRIFHVLPGADASIHDLTLQNGEVPNYTESYVGGAIAAQGNAIIERCNFLYNYAPYYGGAIGVYDAEAVVRDCTFQHNKAIQGGSVIKVWSAGAGAALLMERCTLDNNIDLFGLNFAIDIENWGDRDATLAIHSSTITNNAAGMTIYGPTGAGGLLVRDAAESGIGGAYAELNNVTIADNAYPAVWAEGDDARIDVSNSILTNNGDADCYWNVHSGGHNVVSKLIDPGYELAGTDWVCDFRSSIGDQIGPDPRLNPLEYNGGQTRTREPKPESPARSSGSPLMPGSGNGACEAFDQRGVPRALCDVGAFQTENREPTQNLPPECGTASTDCRALTRAKYKLKDRESDGPGVGDKLVWSWSDDVTTSSELGEPAISTQYSVCIYENGGSTAVAGATIAPGAKWSADGTDLSFYDDNSEEYGVRSVSLRAGTSAGVKGKLQGEGSQLSFGMLPVMGDLRVQLRRSDDALCWEAAFPAETLRKNSRAGVTAKLR